MWPFSAGWLRMNIIHGKRISSAEHGFFRQWIPCLCGRDFSCLNSHTIPHWWTKTIKPFLKRAQLCKKSQSIMHEDKYIKWKHFGRAVSQLRTSVVPVLEIHIHDKQCNLLHWEWMDLHSIITFCWRVNLIFCSLRNSGVWCVNTAKFTQMALDLEW